LRVLAIVLTELETDQFWELNVRVHVVLLSIEDLGEDWDTSGMVTHLEEGDVAEGLEDQSEDVHANACWMWFISISEVVYVKIQVHGLGPNAGYKVFE
jgi:hypothetical protein